MKVLVLFTCYNRKEKTVNCVNSLNANTNIDIQFLVLDDNSSDGTVENLKKFDNVKVLIGDGNSYYSGGMRKVIDEAKKCELEKFDYILMVNDDVTFYKDAINKLIQMNQKYNGVIVGTTIDSKGEISYGGVIKTSRIRPSFKVVMSKENDIKKCDSFCANCVLIPKNIFIKTENIDKIYTHAMGDFDYGFSIARLGYNIYASSFFVGQCDDNSIKGTWRDTTLTRLKRIKMKETVKGLPFKEYFHYLYKNHGIITAILYSFIPYIKILMNK